MRSFKKWAAVFVIICIFVGGNELLTYLLYPYTYTRADMHHMITQEYEDLIVGTSHGKCGLDPQALAAVTGRKTLNVCQGGQYPVDSYYLVREAARHRKLSRVIYELDPGYWVTVPNQSADYVTFFHEMPWSRVKAEYLADKMLKGDFRNVVFPWYFYRKNVRNIGERVEQKRSRVYKEYITKPFQSEVQTFREDGFFARHRLETDKMEEDIPSLWQAPGPREDTMEAFDRLAEFCGKENIELVVVIMPIPGVTYEKYKEHYEAAESFLEKYMTDRNVDFHCYYQKKSADIPDALEEFADYDGHMYEETAVGFSRIFGEDITD